MDISKQTLDVIFGLLPGFVAAWIFYGLTPHKKEPPFERVTNALIFTAIVNALLIFIKAAVLWFGRHIHSFGFWTDDVAVCYSMTLAISMGLLFARLANNNTIHEFLRENKRYESFRKKHETHRILKWLPCWESTCRTSWPSNWYAAFKTQKLYVVLHLKDSRRLYGWPLLFPDHPENGHFSMTECEWLLADGQIAKLYKVESLLVPSQSVELVEFIKKSEDITASESDIISAQTLLVRMQQNEKGDQNGRDVPPETPAGIE